MAPMLLRFVYLTFLLVIGFNGEQEFSQDGEILVLTKENFEKAIRSNENLFVMFYAPWCGHSQAMFEDFAETARKLADEGSHIKLAKIDSENAPLLEDIYAVHSYPTLIFFQKGRDSKYTGKRDTESMIEFLKSNLSSEFDDSQ